VANLVPLAPEHIFCIVDRKEFMYQWHLEIWETTLNNSDPQLIDPENFFTALNPGVSTRVLTEEELVRPGIGYPGIANQVPQTLTQIEEISND
jgi:hypothetical protein